MYTLKILGTSYLTHDVKQFVVEKPKDFVYRPGQSTHLSINLPGWEDKLRPFTFTSLNEWPHLEFIVKIYDDRDGVTKEMGKLNAGAEFLLHDVFGTISYKGPGIFIAGGTGITPFIAIFRALYYSGNLKRVALIYSNKRKDDVILGEELFKMLGPAFMNVFTREGVIGFMEKKIDKKFLIENIGRFDRQFYVCGPRQFTEEITDALLSLGAKAEAIVI
ncbi:MAG TPA: flavodoxin reductase [Flavobacteriaceae bacterium]|nr:flavodoxin reductase [Flavobacteriaceae bacterium]